MLEQRCQRRHPNEVSGNRSLSGRPRSTAALSLIGRRVAWRKGGRGASVRNAALSWSSSAPPVSAPQAPLAIALVCYSARVLAEFSGERERALVRPPLRAPRPDSAMERD